MTVRHQKSPPGAARRPVRGVPEFTSLAEFKNIAVEATRLVAAGRLPAGRKWDPEDHVTVLAYAWLRGVSVHVAAERLNEWAVRRGLHVPAEFADGRRSRAVPHQTSVNAWLRSLDLGAAQELARAVFGAALRVGLRRGLVPRRVVLEYDLTYRGYWGARRDPFIKGSKMVKGTRRIRHYHAAMVHGGGVSLFVALEHVAKGRSKVPFLLSTARWLESLGLEVTWVLVDREYYRHGVLAGLKGIGVDVVTPAVNHGPLKRAKLDYLLGRKGRVQRFSVGTGNRKGRKTLHHSCWLVLYPRGTQSLRAIRGAYRRGLLTLDEAAEQLYGLITTAAPQRHGRSYPRTLRRLYKKRWQIESGFRDEDARRCPWRSDRDGVRLLDELGRMVVYNAWQLERASDPRGRRLTLQTFRDERVDAVTGQFNL